MTISQYLVKIVTELFDLINFDVKILKRPPFSSLKKKKTIIDCFVKIIYCDEFPAALLINEKKLWPVKHSPSSFLEQKNNLAKYALKLISSA